MNDEARDEQSSPARAKAFVLALVEWLDLRMAKEGDDAHLFEREILARALLAAGGMLKAMPTVARTLEAARAYLDAPTEAAYDALQRAATDSYPFGPGDGCYAVSELGYQGCAAGSGCASGAGSIACVAGEVGYERVAQALRAELMPWAAR